MVQGNLDIGFWRMGSVALPKIITEAEYDLAINTVKKIRKRMTFFWENVMHMASYGGLREGEICRVKLEHIDWLEKTILIPIQKNKNNNEKIVVADFLLNKLREHINQYGWQIKYHNNFVFFSQCGDKGSLTPQAIRRFVCDLRKATGLVRTYGKRKPLYYVTNCSSENAIYEVSTKVFNKRLQEWRNKIFIKTTIPAKDSIYTAYVPDELLNRDHDNYKPGNVFIVQRAKEEMPLYVFSFHTLRHLFATRMVERGVTEDEIKQAGRWISIASVERYKHTSLITKRHAVEKAFNEYGVKSEQDMKILKDEISELKNIIKSSMILPHQQYNTRYIEKPENQIARKDTVNADIQIDN